MTDLLCRELDVTSLCLRANNSQQFQWAVGPVSTNYTDILLQRGAGGFELSVRHPKRAGSFERGDVIICAMQIECGLKYGFCLPDSEAPGLLQNMVTRWN